MNKTLMLFNDKKYIELPTDKNYSLNKEFQSEINGNIKVCCDKDECSINGIKLIPFNKTHVGAITCMSFINTFTNYSVNNIKTVKIGNGIGKDIEISDNNTNFTLTDKIINVISGEIYLNGRQLELGEYTCEYGDCILVGNTKIIIKNGYISCGGKDFVCNLKIAINVSEPFEDFPVYKRSPRIIKREPTDTIEISPPPQKEKRKKGQLVKMILPPLLMVCITVAISFLMKRGLFIIISAAGMMMSVVFSLTTYFTDKKDRKEKEIERVQGYENYLLTQRKKLFDLYNKQKESLLFHNPSICEIECMINEYSSRLYERGINDSDFLCVSLGDSEIQSSYKINHKNDSLEISKDELRDEMNEIVSNFVSIPDMPVIIDLKKAHLGIVGEKKHIHKELKSLLVQLCFSQSYRDIEVITLIEEKDQPEFEWIKWYPHCKVKNINISGLVYGENQRDQVLGNIAQVLKARKQKKEEEKKDSMYIPHYVFIIDNPKLVINHSIMEYLQLNSMDLGFSLIYTTNIQANLPENVKTILLLNGKDNGTLLMNEGILIEKSLKLHQIENVDLENISRRLAPIIHNKGVSSQIPDSITFFEMYNIKKPEQLPIQRLWATNASNKSLAVPLGVRAKDDYVYLDLHEKAHGPHGLVAGTTGSGKSEILQSYILSLAVNFHPYEVGFLLIDYKGGGMANLFKNLPHLLGTITNLDGSESMRALASIKSELARRQRIFNECNVNNINQYTKLFKAKEVNQPLPHLFLISDEFAELKKEQPEFMSELVSAARIGRSLGVHLILATQKPTGVVDDQIWSNSKFKLALKVQDEADSKEVLKTPDAARITQPGRSYLQVGNNEIYELFQSAWSGATYSENTVKLGFDSRVYLINSLGQGQLVNQDLSDLDAGNDSKLTQLDVVVEHINKIYTKMNSAQVEKPWLPPLKNNIVTPHLLGSTTDTGEIKDYHLNVPIGMVDIPEEQKQIEYVHNFMKDGNLAVFGSSGFGKSTFEMAVAVTLACNNSSELLNFYVLDFGNSTLAQLRGLPHTADYLSFDDSEKLKKLVKILTEEMRKRKLSFAQKNAINFKMYNSLVAEKLPAIIIFIDNYDIVKEIGIEFEEFLNKLTRDGSSIGIYIVITASRSNSVKYAVLNNFKNKIAQFMFDSTDTMAIVGRSNYKLPEVKGRALVKLQNVSVMQCYLPAPYENDAEYVNQVGNIIDSIKSNNTARCPEGIRMLPEILNLSELSKSSKNTDKKIGVGLDTEDVEAQYVDLTIPIHLIVGASQTGKSNMLKLIYKQCIAEKVFICDSKGYDLQEFDNNENIIYANSEDEIKVFAQELEIILKNREKMFAENGVGIRPRDFYSKLPTTLIIIDDVDHFIELSKPIASQMENLIKKAIECGVCIIATTLPSRMRGYDNITKTLKETQNGIILGNPGDQNIFMFQPPRGYRQQVDMGFIYNRSNSKIIKIPLV